MPRVTVHPDKHSAMTLTCAGQYVGKNELSRLGLLAFEARKLLQEPLPLGDALLPCCPIVHLSGTRTHVAHKGMYKGPHVVEQ